MSKLVPVAFAEVHRPPLTPSSCLSPYPCLRFPNQQMRNIYETIFTTRSHASSKNPNVEISIVTQPQLLTRQHHHGNVPARGSPHNPHHPAPQYHYARLRWSQHCRTRLSAGLPAPESLGVIRPPWTFTAVTFITRFPTHVHAIFEHERNYETF
jgi:hypothetical protein